MTSTAFRAALALALALPVAAAACTGPQYKPMTSVPTHLDPPTKTVDYTFGGPKEIRMTCSPITGEPVMATHRSGGEGGTKFPLAQADYLRMVKSGHMPLDPMYTDPNHPSFNEPCHEKG